MPSSAPSAVPAATGSLASATTSRAGLSPRRTPRSKPAGISTPNRMSPERIQWSISASVRATRDDAEVGGVAERGQDRAAEIAVLVDEHGGRQVARRGVDGEAEQQELHDRNEDHGGEGDAVAPQLHELLDEHGPGARQRRRPAQGRGASIIGSCPASAHQVDEHVLERGLGHASSAGRVGAELRDGRVERRRVAAGDVQAGAERRHHVDAGHAQQLLRRAIAGRGR